MANPFPFDPFAVIPILAVLIGMAVGLVTIWNSVKTNQQKQKADSIAADVASENRLKEYFDLRVRIVETEVIALKSEIHTMNDTYTQKLEDRSRFFTEWANRLEEKINNAIKS